MLKELMGHFERDLIEQIQESLRFRKDYIRGVMSAKWHSRQIQAFISPKKHHKITRNC